MQPNCAPDCATEPQYTKSAGDSPLPGYVLLEPLGRGGFGEVWKCMAPGGLHKAIKFVAGEATDSVIAGASCSAQLRQECAAFEQIKAIRHPFLLTIERVELIDDELVMVMELADHQLGDRFEECRANGLPGIPREELLGYLREAAEALDVISNQYGLQHLDVKPANLFITAGHVQVGDYGLVSRLDAKKGADNPGLTPRYASPEVLRGQIHTRSDQYSLALVYFELLTGTFPYTARNVQQMMVQHMTAVPDLRALPVADRTTVSKALSKDPEVRFASCGAFIRTLIGAERPPGGSRLVTPGGRSGRVDFPPSTQSVDPGTSNAPTRGPGSNETARHPMSAGVTPVPAPSPVRPGRPQYAAPHDVLTPAPVEQMASRSLNPRDKRLAQIRAVVPVAWLQQLGGPPSPRPAAQVVNAIVSAAEASAGPATPFGTVIRDTDGSWKCRFLTTIDPRVAQVKLDLLWELGSVTMDTRTEGRVVFRRMVDAPASTGFFGFGKKKATTSEAGLEVVVELPEPKNGTAEVAVRGRFFGSPPLEFKQTGEKTILRLMDGIQSTLQNVVERRKHPRVPATFPLVLYPLHSDGRLEAPMQGVCHNVSAGGIALFCGAKPPTKYLYVAFEDVPVVSGFAVLISAVRCEWRDSEVFLSGRFRLDINPSAEE